MKFFQNLRSQDTVSRSGTDNSRANVRAKSPSKEGVMDAHVKKYEEIKAYAARDLEVKRNAASLLRAAEKVTQRNAAKALFEKEVEAVLYEAEQERDNIRAKSASRAIKAREAIRAAKEAEAARIAARPVIRVTADNVLTEDAAKELAARRAARSARLAEVVAWTNTMVREIRAARVAAIQAKVKAETLAAREAAKQNVRTAVLTGRSNARALAIEAVIRNRAARSVE